VLIMYVSVGDSVFVSQTAGIVGGLAAVGAGLWAANEYGYINLSGAEKAVEKGINKVQAKIVSRALAAAASAVNEMFTRHATATSRFEIKLAALISFLELGSGNHFTAPQFAVVSKGRWQGGCLQWWHSTPPSHWLRLQFHLGTQRIRQVLEGCEIFEHSAEA